MWYLAEGATHSGFDLFYLLQNPNASEARVRVRFLRPSGAPLEKEYSLSPNSRTNIWVNQEDFVGLGKALASTDVSAVFESLNGQPIIVERALYLDLPGQPFGGHERSHHRSSGSSPKVQGRPVRPGANPRLDARPFTAPRRRRHREAHTVAAIAGSTSADLGSTPGRHRGVDDGPFNEQRAVVERALWWPGTGCKHNSLGRPLPERSGW
jgi:hypothetical protein